MRRLKRKVEELKKEPTISAIGDMLEEFCGVRYSERDLTSRYGILVRDPLHPEYGIIIKIYIGHIYYTYYKLDHIDSLVQKVAESMDDYYSSEYAKEEDARRLLLKGLLKLRGRTGNIEVSILPRDKETFFSALRRNMDIFRNEIDYLVEQNIDAVLTFWEDLHSYSDDAFN